MGIDGAIVRGNRLAEGLKVRFWGVRGSIPCSGAEYARYGGNTSCLEVSARTADGVIMGVRHRELQVEGVQFHPESILTPQGMALLANFLERA